MSRAFCGAAIAVLLIVMIAPVLAGDINRFHTGDVIQRRIPPPNGAYWKVWDYNQTSGNYTLEPVRPVTWYPYWTPLGGKLSITRRFVDPRFALKGHSGIAIVQEGR